MPATPNLALFLSSIARLQTMEEASLPDSVDIVSGEAIMALRWEMVVMSARVLFRSGFKERLKRMAKERSWMIEEEEEFEERVSKAGIAPCDWATKFLF